MWDVTHLEMTSTFRTRQHFINTDVSNGETITVTADSRANWTWSETFRCLHDACELLSS